MSFFDSVATVSDRLSSKFPFGRCLAIDHCSRTLNWLLFWPQLPKRINAKYLDQGRTCFHRHQVDRTHSHLLASSVFRDHSRKASLFGRNQSTTNHLLLLGHPRSSQLGQGFSILSGSIEVGSMPSASPDRGLWPNYHPLMDGDT